VVPSHGGPGATASEPATKWPTEENKVAGPESEAMSTKRSQKRVASSWSGKRCAPVFGDAQLADVIVKGVQSVLSLVWDQLLRAMKSEPQATADSGRASPEWLTVGSLETQAFSGMGSNKGQPGPRENRSDATQ
jgi:hypothetical protein